MTQVMKTTMYHETFCFVEPCFRTAQEIHFRLMNERITVEEL